MKENGRSQIQAVSLPPTWCASLCRNAMNERCIEDCALKRDCSGFELKPGINLIDMPRFPLEESGSMTREEKFTSVTIYLAKVIDHLNGKEEQNSHTIYPTLIRLQDQKKMVSDISKLLISSETDLEEKADT